VDKIFITIGFLIIGMVGYYLVELFEKYNVLPEDHTGKKKPIDKICRIK